jgi:hypothetical protein
MEKKPIARSCNRPEKCHAKENQALSIMKPQISRIENYPKVAAKLEAGSPWPAGGHRRDWPSVILFAESERQP